MPEDTKKNPIEQRIDYLSGLWNEFAKDPEPRLLRWLVDDDGVRMVELLIEMQNEEVGDIPDLFIRFETPFTDAQSYPFDLLVSLKEQYKESREDIASQDLPTDWQCPQPQPGETGLQTFVRACTSFKEYYHGKMLALALFLAPTNISNPAAWSDFLLSFARSGLPSTVRITVIDHIEWPALDALCKAEQRLIKTVTPELDMSGALEELAETAEGVGPGNDFRKLFVRLSNLAAKGDVKAANKAATAALRIAKKQKWFDLQVAVHMVLGAMHMGKGAATNALATYREAGKLALQAQQAEDPSGGKLVVQTRFAEAAVLINERKYAEAAPLYEETAPLARANDDTFLELEAWRMASYCYEMTEQPKDAWRCGNQALKVGERLDEKIRPNSTLPYMGKRLLEFVDRYQVDKKYKEEVRRQMVALVGNDWEAKVQSGGQAT